MANDDFQLPGDFGLPATSQLYVGGIKLEDAVAGHTVVEPGPPKDAIRIPHVVPGKTPPKPQIAPQHRFWSSPPRALNWPFSDGIIINLAKPKKINYLALDLPAFPHHFFMQWWDAPAKKWREFKGPSTGSIRIYIDGSTPAIVGPASAYQAKQHPSHYGAGHWLHYDIDINPVTTSKIRMSGNRNFGSRKGGPKDPLGRPAKYSLGVRNLDFGWRVRSKKDVPRTPRDPDILTENQSFTQTLDLLGSPVELKMRENRASDLLRGSVWKCEPMPVPYAVVNFYVDARDSSGGSQIIDRFNVMPLQAGANLNLYYSDQVPDADFGASDAPIVFPMLRTAGEVQPKVEPSGILFSDKISYLDLTNQGVQWNPQRPFWFGIEFQPQWRSTDTTPHIIFDTGALQLAWNDGVFRLNYGGGALYQQPLEFDSNARLRVFVSYDGQRLSFYMPETGAVANVPTVMTGMTSQAIRLGAELGDSTAPAVFTGKYRLNAMVLKQESLVFVSGTEGLIVPDPVARFIEDPSLFLDKPEYEIDEDGSTDNALLRYLPRFAVGSGATSANPHGFLGGPGTIYEDVVWTPVMRDYKLRAGMLQFHPVRARFFKFEFTNLTPEPYQTYAPITREVKTYSQAATRTQSGPQKTSSIQQSATSTGLTANADATMQTVRYADTPAITNPSEDDVLPTEALYAQDLGIQQQLDDAGGLYRFDSWQPGTTAPRYDQTSRHYYETVKVGHSKKIAYFVGLSKLEMFRVDYAADDDTEQYIELFDDTGNIDPQYLTEKIVTGTTNFVPNPSFENGITGHTAYTNGTVTAATFGIIAGGMFGVNALRVSATALGAATTDRVGWQATYATPTFGSSVAYSIFAKKISGNSPAVLRLNLEYYTAGAAFISSDSRSFTPDAELGEVLNANPGFETDLTGWSGQGGTLIRTTSQFHAGVSSGQMTPDGVTATVRINGDLVPVTAGKSYRAQGWLRCANARTVNLNINWYDADGAYLSTGSNFLAVSANTWTYLAADLTAPANAAQANIIPTLTGTPPSGHVLWTDEIELREVVNAWQRYSAILLPPPTTASVKAYWWLEAGAGQAVDYHFDGYQIENLRLTDYCDGDQPGCAWAGTAHSSASSRAGVNIRPWGWDGDRLVTGSNVETSVTTTSRRFASKRRVRGVQYATQQSASVQLVPDPDFAAIDLEAAWKAEGDVVTMEHSDDINSTLGNAVKVLRSSSINTWGELRATYPTWGAVEASEDGDDRPIYSTLAGDGAAVGYGGIALRTPVQVSPTGRVTAAARVYADHTLSGTLTLQILSSFGDVLAQKDQVVTAGRVVEWSVGYTIGETPAVTQTWGGIMQRDASPVLPTYEDLQAGTWADLTSIEVAQSRQLSVRVIQSGPGQDTWYVDSVALFEDPILWEFTNDDGNTWWPALDIRNDPHGVLIFPNSLAPVPSDPTGLRWRVTGFRPGLHISALDIRPWYAETVFGIPRREPGVSGGPNIQPTDHYPPIEDDPFFRGWSDPVPQDWFFVYRQLLLLDRETRPVTEVIKPDTFANPEALLVDVDLIPPAPPFLDLYTENYSGEYGVPNLVDQGIYEDEYDPENDY